MEIFTRRVLRTIFVALLAMFVYAAPATAAESQSEQNQVGATVASAASVKESKPHVVKGKVLDENGQPMIGVGVIIVNTLQGANATGQKYYLCSSPK